MKLCRYDDDRLGVVRGDVVHDVTEAQTEIRKSSPYAMKGDAVVAALPQWRERIERMADKAPGKPIAHVKLLAPVARPTKLSCAPTNYQAHIEEMRKASQQPGSQIVSAQSSKILEAGMFLKANSALVGPSEGIPIRFPDRRNDHEVELVMVIGKAGSDIPQAKALDYVAGYCLGLDMTVRGREDRSFRKSVDGYAVLGPWMVTADEIPDPDSLPISIEVNGEVRQKSNTSQLIYNCRRLIEFASEFYTLYPGDLVYTGTPEGVSPVKPGDSHRLPLEPGPRRAQDRGAGARIGRSRERSARARSRPRRQDLWETLMLQIKRAGHSTLTTPDLERMVDYFTRIVGLSLVAREKNRAILATKSGLEAIVLERGGAVDSAAARRSRSHRAAIPAKSLRG